MDENTKEQIKKLKSEEKYDEIFYRFGSKEYRKNTPYKIRKEELEDLYNDGRFFDIYNKYGEKKYNKYLIKAMFQDIYDNKGPISAFMWNVKRQIKNGFAGLIASVLIAPPTIGILGAEYASEEKEKNGITYQQEIKEYNQKIEKYAEEVNSMQLTDIQVFMKVMRDMWGEIQGYKEPQKDIIGYWELDLATEDGYGVCRNMAMDVAQKLNAINPKYNARTMAVLVEDFGNYKNANIKTKIIKNEQENLEDNSSENKVTLGELLASTVTGNHLVTLVDSPEDNLILVLDPTNPGIGIFKDGKIEMFNSDKNDEADIKAKIIISPSFSKKGGMDGIKEIITDCTKSYSKSRLKQKEVREKYGLEAQNDALNEVKQIETNKKRLFWDTIKVDTSNKKQYNMIEKDNKEQGEGER